MSNREGKKHKCAQCAYITSTSSALVIHERTHTGDKPYKCDQCTYACARKFNLIKHKRRHAGEKPFKCDQCGYASVSSGDVTRHKIKHTGEKRYKCDECTFACAINSNMILHKRRHAGEKPFKCDQCGYSSVSSGDLARHIIKHTGQKPYKCDKCSYSAMRKCQLIAHREKHTGKTPYRCDQCAMTFNLEQNSYKCDQCKIAVGLKENSFISWSVELCRLTNDKISSYCRKPNFDDEIKHEPDRDPLTERAMVSDTDIDSRPLKKDPEDFIDQVPNTDLVEQENLDSADYADPNAVHSNNQESNEHLHIDKAMVLGTERLESDTTIITAESLNFINQVPKTGLVKQEDLNSDDYSDPNAVRSINQDTIENHQIDKATVLSPEWLESDTAFIKAEPLNFLNQVPNTSLVKPENLVCDDAADPNAIYFNNQDTIDNHHIDKAMVLSPEWLESDTTIIKAEP